MANTPDLHKRLVEISTSYGGYIGGNQNGMWPAMFEAIEKHVQSDYLPKTEVEAAIGEDEKVVWYGVIDAVALKMNEYRAELREKLGLKKG